MSSPIAMIIPAVANLPRNTEIAESLTARQVIGSPYARHRAIKFNKVLRPVVRFTPASSSWLNLVQRRFAVLSTYCKQIKDSRH